MANGLIRILVSGVSLVAASTIAKADTGVYASFGTELEFVDLATMSTYSIDASQLTGTHGDGPVSDFATVDGKVYFQYGNAIFETSQGLQGYTALVWGFDGDPTSFTIGAATAPEPSTVTLLAIGFLGLAFLGRRSVSAPGGRRLL